MPPYTGYYSEDEEEQFPQFDISTLDPSQISPLEPKPGSLYGIADDYDESLAPNPMSAVDPSFSQDYTEGYAPSVSARGALVSTLSDSERDFSTPSIYSKSRELLESQNEIHADVYKQLRERYMHPNYEMGPEETWASAALSILPTAVGYFMGGKQGGAAGAQAGLQGLESIDKNYKYIDQQERAAALQASRDEMGMLQRGQQQVQALDVANLNNETRLQIADARLKAAGQNKGLMTKYQEDSLGISRERLALEKQRHDISEGKNEALQNSGKLRGVGWTEGHQPDPGVVNKIADKYTDYLVVKDSLEGLKSSFEDPSASLKDQQAAFSRAVTKIKNKEGMGASLTDGERALVVDTLPAIANFTSVSKFKEYLQNNAQGQQAVAIMNRAIANEVREMQLTLGARYGYLEGTEYDSATAKSLQIPEGLYIPKASGRRSRLQELEAREASQGG